MRKTRMLFNAAAVLLTWAALSTPTAAECNNNSDCEWWPGLSDECEDSTRGGSCFMEASGECHNHEATCDGVEH